jgi:uncharacterized membrane protein YkoI
MKRTWILPLLLVLALVVTIGAPAANAEDGAVKGRIAAVKKALSLTKISLETAVATAAKKANGTAFATDFEVEDGVPVFEVIVYVDGDAPHLVEVEIDAVTGKVLETEIVGQDDADDDDDDDAEDEDEEEEEDDDDALAGTIKELGAAMPTLKIALAKAVALAATKAKGTAFVSRFEMDDGIPTFEVFVFVDGEVPHLMDVDIDARDPDGKVLEMEKVGKGGGDDDDEEDEDEDEEDEEEDDD